MKRIFAALVAVLLLASLADAAPMPRVIIGSDVAPTLSTCGASSALTTGSSDAAGEITITTNATTTCILLFGQTYPVNPNCYAVNKGAVVSGTAAINALTTTTQVTFSVATGYTGAAAAMTGMLLAYHCELPK